MQGDRDDQWDNMPADGEGWDKPSTVDKELIDAAKRVRRYNDAPLVGCESWCDEYDSSQQYGNDLAMLADFATTVILGEPLKESTHAN